MRRTYKENIMERQTEVNVVALIVVGVCVVKTALVAKAIVRGFKQGWRIAEQRQFDQKFVEIVNAEFG
jgi:hypothetical protein